jgi:predicted metal-dependent peptidase
MTPAEIIMAKVRTQFVLHNPFMAVLALRLKYKETSTVPTMATDGSELLFNAEFVNSLSFNEVMGVVAHEVMHCALLHPYRRGERDPKKWNAACDYTVNFYIEQHGYILPKDRLYDAKYAGMSADEVYSLLPEGAASPSWGLVDDGAESNAERAEKEAEWRVAMRDAISAAKSAGQQNGSFEQVVKETAPLINWRDQLFNCLSACAKNDYAWYPPNLSYLTRKLHVPSLNSPSLGKVVWFEDTSGSMGDKELAASRSEFRSILETLPCAELVFIQGDTCVQSEIDVDDFEDVGYEVIGGGGTDFDQVFERVKELNPDILLCFTDMGVSHWPEQPDYEVIWLRTEKTNAPFGRYVDVYRR